MTDIDKNLGEIIVNNLKSAGVELITTQKIINTVNTRGKDKDIEEITYDIDVFVDTTKHDEELRNKTIDEFVNKAEELISFLDFIGDGSVYNEKFIEDVKSIAKLLKKNEFKE